jgi:hypothetical protein
VKSIADSLRAEQRAADAARPFAERLRAALALGRRDILMLAAARGVSEQEAARIFARQRQDGRRRSRCHEGVIG